MTWTYDLETDIGKARLYGQDHSTEETKLFSDEEIQVFLDSNSDSVFLAAATMLEHVANDQTLLLLKVTLGGGALVTDGPAVAEDLRKGAALLRKQALSADFDEDAFWDSQIDYAEMVNANYEQVLYNSRYR